jgi:hypothetical protein
MITKNLRINQLSPAAYERYLSYLKAMDNRDIEAYAEFLADNVRVQFNNEPPLQAKRRRWPAWGRTGSASPASSTS